MITLKRIYSETNLFNEVCFKEGLNIILGKYSSQRKEINGIGKSTLVRLIDYCLLSQIAKNKFFNIKKFPFLEGHNVVLEFYLEDKSYFIKRWFDKKNILFGNTDGSNVNEYSEKELKSVLSEIFFKTYDSIYYDSKWFRSLIKFFIKDDLNHQDRKVPYNFVHPSTPKNLVIVYNFYLIGLPNKNLYQLEQLKQELKEINKVRNKIVDGLEEETGKSIQELQSELKEIKEKVQMLELALTEYDFIDTYKDIEDRISYLTNEISKKLVEIQQLQKKLDLIQESYSVRIEVDIDEAVKFYNILSTQLGGLLKKTLEDIINFRKAIADNRRKYLAEREREIKDNLNKAWEDYRKLEKERQKLYKILDSKGNFDIIKDTYQKLLDEATAYKHIENIMKEIDKWSNKILQLEEEISELYFTIVKELQDNKERISDLSLSFRNTIRNCAATSEGSYLAIEATQKKENPIDIKIDIPKSLSYGREKLKILVYDLTLFREILMHERPVPHFLIHDGVLHGIDMKTKIRILNSSYKLLEEFNNNAQYILTFNEGDIIDGYEGEKLLFELDDHIIVKYEDNPERMIFRREF